MTSQDLPSEHGPRAERPKRRTFNAAYKLRMVEEYDAAEHGDKGALMNQASNCGANPQRFTRTPALPKLPTVAWINRPDEDTTTDQADQDQEKHAA